jgi:quinol monooxygenase YgiN
MIVDAGSRPRKGALKMEVSDQEIIITKITALPGKRDEVIAALSELATAVQEEPGTLVFAIATDTGDDVTVWPFEMYADDAAMQAHTGNGAFKGTVTKTQDMTVPGEVHMLRPVASKGLPV